MFICNFWQKKWNGSYLIFIPSLTSYSLASPQNSFSLDIFKIVLDRNAPPSKSCQCTCYTQRSQRISQQVTWNFNYIYSGTWNSVSSLSKVFCFILDSRNHRANIDSTFWSSGSQPWGILLSRECVAMAGRNFGCHSFGECSVSSRQRAATRLNISQHTGQAHTSKCQFMSRRGNPGLVSLQKQPEDR